MSQKRGYKQYPKEFKDEAVELVLEQGYSVADAAKLLGIVTNMLYRLKPSNLWLWIKGQSWQEK
jgi:transposase